MKIATVNSWYFHIRIFIKRTHKGVDFANERDNVWNFSLCFFFLRSRAFPWSQQSCLEMLSNLVNVNKVSAFVNESSVYSLPVVSENPEGSRFFRDESVESLQSHFIHTMSHWSSGLPVCFPSWGTRVQIPRGVIMWNWGSPGSVVLLHWWPPRDPVTDFVTLKVLH